MLILLKKWMNKLIFLFVLFECGCYCHHYCCLEGGRGPSLQGSWAGMSIV